MDQNQNQSSWQPIAQVLEKKITVEEPAAEKPVDEPKSISNQNMALLEKLVNHLNETIGSLNALVKQITNKNFPPHDLFVPTDLSDPLKKLSSEILDTAITPLPSSPNFSSTNTTEQTSLRVLEGVFDGTRMVGADGAFYPVPPNYASKSKLVEGDLLKLTISPNGSFIYKQIGPTKRKRLVGELIKRQDGETILYDVFAENHVFHVLSAAITYYKGQSGDEAAILVPEDAISKWAAVDYIVKKS